jgi:hypothetical protein|nr:MAG TPA: hypothetical protein [Caudoviricetes sp.]
MFTEIILSVILNLYKKNGGNRNMEEEKYTTAPMDTEIEVSLDEADQYEEAQKEKPKVDLTEEEAKVAAENVSKLIDVLDRYKPINQRRKEKFDKIKKELDELPEGHYKKKQLSFKLLELSKKISPKVFWDSKTKGTYRKKSE